MSILREIQPTVMQYADVIANVIKVDVEIVDSQLFRVAGTGVYRHLVNQDMSNEGYVYKQALATGEFQYIEEPGKHQLCARCPKQDQCDEKLELCTPIKLQDETLGVIGLICFNDEQKQNILKDFVVYQQFLNHIAEFISAKAYEYKEHERAQMMMSLFEQVINSVNKGILVLDGDNQITNINNSAMQQLSLSQSAINQKVSLEATGDSLLGSEEYRVTIGTKKYYLMGQLLSVSPKLSMNGKIFLFDEIKNVKSGIYGLTNIATPVSLGNIIGESMAMEQMKEKILKIATSKSTVLITGESGTGKEMVARAIHAESSRYNKPFIAINCGAIPDTLLESELFGYVKGAFTGADPKGKIGKFELANKGVIFLDEIGDMPLYLQVKLLRVLQERKLTRIGSNQSIDFDVRVVAATNKDLKKLINENKFREDLYYRLNVIPIEVPPLRERKEDLPLLVKHMIEKYQVLFDKVVQDVDVETMELLANYLWPGNVRELENTVEFMINMADNLGVLTKETLPQNLLQQSLKTMEQDKEIDIRPLREVEQQHVLQAVKFFGNSTQGKKAAAKHLGIGIATLYRKLESYQQS